MRRLLILPLSSLVVVAQLATPVCALAATPAKTAATAHHAEPHHAAHTDKAPATPAAPKSIGKFDDWQAATHDEGGKQACYAFTRALPARADTVLTVTQRAEGRDAVAITTGSPVPDGTETALEVNGARLPFYAAQHALFARDGHAVTTAFGHATTAQMKLPAAKGKAMLDKYSLRGFPAAYAAINKACP